ncbi:MAG: DUF4406 domain-containing protein [Bacteroidales bacterium]|nr:DUF4406 domain-containing protein [Bacteroidales bacterium]
MKFKKLYLSLPITGCEMQSVVEASEAQNVFERKGYEVINPHDIKRDLTETLNRIPLEIEIMGADLYSISQCDAMILLPGWQNSKGCNLEIRFALDYNIPIYDYQTMKKIIFDSHLKNKARTTVFDSWITQPVHIEEPVLGMPSNN